MESEQAQALRLAAEATYPGLKAAIEAYGANLPPAPVPTPEPVAAPTEPEVVAKAVTAATAAAAQPKPVCRSAPVSTGKKYVPVENFSWDQGGYNSATISVYVDIEGVGEVKDGVRCEFKKDSFDLTVHGINGQNFRLFKDNLEKDIVPADSKFIVKRNKVVLKLQKVKGEYSFEHWGNLTSKKSREEATARKKDPMGGIMDMMKDMYNDGDDNMKKIIGEAMLKSQRGEKPDMPDIGGDMPKF